MAESKPGIPKKDGSGKGTRDNAGRSGHTPLKTGKGKNKGVGGGRNR